MNQVIEPAIEDKSSEWTGRNKFVLYKYVSFNFNAWVHLLMTIPVYVVEIFRTLYVSAV
jgi:hypothetical protein